VPQNAITTEFGLRTTTATTALAAYGEASVKQRFQLSSARSTPHSFFPKQKEH
jgi:hypothetical protein